MGQAVVVQNLVDSALIGMDTLTEQRSRAWIQDNILPADEIEIFSYDGSIEYREKRGANTTSITLQLNGIPEPHLGPLGEDQLVRAYLFGAHLAPSIPIPFPDGRLILSYHGRLDRVSILRIDSNGHLNMHQRFTSARLPWPLQFTLEYEPVEV